MEKIELGLYIHNGKLEPFEIERDNFLFLGKPKTGKSETLFRLALDDIHANRAVVFFGKFADVLNRIPRRRLKDVILVEPAKRPFALNLLRDIPPHLHSLTAGKYYEAIKSIWFTSDVSTANIEQYLRSAVQTLLNVPDATLFHAKLLYTDPEYRAQVTKGIADPFLANFWDDFETIPKKDKRPETSSTLNKLRVFFLDSHVRESLLQKQNKLAFKDKIVLVDLDEATLGKENASLLGALTLAYLYIQGLEGLSTTVYIDGADRYGSAVIGNLLTLHSVSTILTLQSIKKSPDILDSVGQVVPFRTSVKDAKVLTPEFQLDNDNLKCDIFKLPDYHAYVRTGNSAQELYMPPVNYPRAKPKHIRAAVRRCKSEYSMRPKDLNERLGRFFAK